MKHFQTRKRLIQTVLFACFTLLSVNYVKADEPNFDWVRQAGGTSTEKSYAVAADPSGNVIITGYFYGSASFGSVNLIANGTTDIFVAKYDASGNIIWAKNFGVQDYNGGTSVATDRFGNIYISGYFAESITFGSCSFSATYTDLFLLKMDASGNVKWAKQIEGEFKSASSGWSADPCCLTVDNSGNIYVCGNFRNTAKVGSFNLLSEGYKDILIAKFNSSGAVVWAISDGGEHKDIISAITIDNSNNISITGHFEESTRFGNNQFNCGWGNHNIFIVQYNSNGNFKWAKSAGGNGSSVYAYGIATDDYGNLIITGDFGLTAYFDSKSITSYGLMDIFIAKYNRYGNVIWIKQAGANSENDVGKAITTDSQGNIYLTGYFEDEARFDPIIFHGNDDDRIFIAKYNLDGDVQWVKKAGSPSGGYDCGEGVVVTNSGEIYVTGRFRGYATFEPFSLTSQGDSKPDIFLAKLTEQQITTPEIALNLTSLSQTCTEGTNASTQYFKIWNSGDGTLSYSISDNSNWLYCSPSSGSSTGEQNQITVNYNTTDLSEGNYNATITIGSSNASNSPQTISIDLSVSEAQNSEIGYSPVSLSQTITTGTDASSQIFKVWNSGNGTLSYSISDNRNWLNCSPSSGNSTGEQDQVTVNYNTANLSEGNYNATITISSANAGNSPQYLNLTLIVKSDNNLSNECFYLAKYYDSAIESVLENLNYNITKASAIPSDFSDYDLLLVHDYDGDGSSLSAKLENYIKNGGGIVLIGGAPSIICGGGYNTTCISEWFGTSQYSNVGASYAKAVFDNPLGTSVEKNDIIEECTGWGGAAVKNVIADATVLTEWDYGSGNIHSFIRQYQSGRIAFWAGYASYNSNTFELFKAVCQWVGNSQGNQGLVAFYSFSGNADDESGNGFHGNVVGASMSQDRFGDSNSAYHFDGNRDYIELPGSSRIINQVQSISFWVYFDVEYSPGTDNKNQDYLLSKAHDTGWQRDIITRDNTNYIRNTFGTSSSSSSDLITSIPFSKSRWYHVVFVRSQTTNTVYVNGNYDNSNNYSGYHIDDSDYLMVGTYHDNYGIVNSLNRSLKGKIDDIRIYNRTLSASEVKNLYDNSKSNIINYSENKKPHSFSLSQNYPNPFNPTTTVTYDLPEQSNVKIEIFDLTGRRVKTLINSVQETGTHSVNWNAEDKQYQRVSSGIYICRMTAGKHVLNRKLIFAK